METHAARDTTRMHLGDLTDFPSIRAMLDAYRSATGMPGGIIDAAHGSVLLGDDWPAVCRLFHRAHPESAAQCRTRASAASAPGAREQEHVFTCGNGLPGIRIPIVVGQEHLATLMFGPFRRLEAPLDQAYFQEQAARLGYDAPAYAAALEQVPAFAADAVEQALAFGRAAAAFIAAAAGNQKRLLAELAARQSAEAALHEKAAFVAHLVNAIPSPVFFKDRSGIYRECNDAFAAMLRRDKADIIGKSASAITPADFARKYADMDERLYREGGVQRYEWSVPDVSGVVREYLFIKSIFVVDDQPAGLIGIMTDITTRKQAEKSLAALCLELERRVRDRTKALASANERLVEVDRMKSAFLSTVSHEVRTPMTSILGFVKLVVKDMSKYVAPAIHDDAALKSKVERIEDNLQIIAFEGERLTRLLNDVLDAARIESGKMQWEDQVFPIKDFLHLAVDTIKGQVGPQLDVSLSDDGSAPWVLADPDRIMQVMMNLLNNAVKFTAQGRIAVSLASKPDGWLEIGVSDTGIGIAADELDKVFDSFHQTGQKSGQDKPKGTGLGLSICKQVVEHYGGRIWAESLPGQGSRFVFLLPRHSAVA